MWEDWDLIEASFATQYSIRLREEPDMSFSEFKSLLGGLMNKTPLGQVISIRSESDPDVLAGFNSAQKRVRAEWRNKTIAALTEEEQRQSIEGLQKAMKEMFSNDD